MTELKLGKGSSLASYPNWYGQSDDELAPWERAGYDIKFYGPTSGNPQIMWGINSNHVKKRIRHSLIKDVADWYVCGFIAGNETYDSVILSEFKDIKRESSVEFQAALLKASITENLYYLFKQYFFYACARESRYHSQVSKQAGRSRVSICKSWRNLSDHFGPEQASAWLIEVFNPNFNSWNNSYGGSRWMEIAKVLHWGVVGHMKNGLPFTKDNFIDTSVSLQHNNGSALNKIEWGVSMYTFRQMCDDQHQGVGELIAWCSEDVQKLYMRKVKV